MQINIDDEYHMVVVASLVAYSWAVEAYLGPEEAECQEEHWGVPVT